MQDAGHNKDYQTMMDDFERQGPVPEIESDPVARREIEQLYASFREETLKPVPGYLRECYGDSLIMNFQILNWYQREILYLFLFRILFVFMYYAVPFTVSSFLLWAGVVDDELAVVVELLLVGYYTGPITQRAAQEVKWLRYYVKLWKLLVIQVDVPIVILLFSASAATRSETSELTKFLTSTGFAVPSILAFVFCLYYGYTIYAFGLIGRYTFFPKALFEDLGNDSKTFMQRFRALNPLPQVKILAKTAGDNLRQTTESMRLRKANGKTPPINDPTMGEPSN